MLKIIRFVFGYITFSATGRFPERFINLTGTRGICLFNVKKSEDGFVCSGIAGNSVAGFEPRYPLHVSQYVFLCGAIAKW